MSLNSGASNTLASDRSGLWDIGSPSAPFWVGLLFILTHVTSVVVRRPPAQIVSTHRLREGVNHERRRRDSLVACQTVCRSSTNKAPLCSSDGGVGRGVVDGFFLMHPDVFKSFVHYLRFMIANPSPHILYLWFASMWSQTICDPVNVTTLITDLWRFSLHYYTILFFPAKSYVLCMERLV